jgi:hypothetical protein
MSRLYFILSVAGWAWLVIVAIFLIVRLTLVRKAPARGVDVIDPPTVDVPPAEGRIGEAR